MMVPAPHGSASIAGKLLETPDIQARLKKIKLFTQENVGSGNQGQIFISNNPWNSFTSLQFPYTSKFASVPVFGIGKIYKDSEATKAALAFQSHHGLTDGYHIGHFLHHLERHLRDPSLLERPFRSTFK